MQIVFNKTDGPVKLVSRSQLHAHFPTRINVNACVDIHACQIEVAPLLHATIPSRNDRTIDTTP